MKISVIFTTYNSHEWLQKVLWGWNNQTDRSFEIVIADDGSNEPTRAVIEQFRAETDIEVKHVWHEDNGFQKCRILNKALLAAEGEYIVMSDGDCIARNDFIAEHRKNAKPGWFLTGGYFKLPMTTSETITKEDIEQGRCFDKNWLIRNGVKRSPRLTKLTCGPIRSWLLNRIIPTKKSWNGHNSSCFKRDALKVNGFDERMKYGGLDAEFGGRLENAGLKIKRVRYNTVCIHLDHARGYANPEDMKNNRVIRLTSINDKLVETPAGIKQH